MIIVNWHRYRFDSRTCYEGRVNGEIWYNLTIHETNNYIALIYSKYAGIDQSEVPVYYKFKDTNNIRAVKKICDQDANSDKPGVLTPYRDVELYDLSERVSKVLDDTDKLIKKIKSQSRK
jgi:hypothetical protein